MKAVVTAGGRGTRLYPITRAMPKELINFCGVPVVEYGINFLRDSGIKDILVITGTKKGALQDYIGNGELFGVNIAYVIQEQYLGLGDAISKVEPYANGDNEDFVLLLGDTIIIGNKDLKEMIKIHKRYNASATILVEHVKEPEKYGVIKFDNLDTNKIISLYEKPKEDKIKEEFKTNDGWYAIAGLYILNRDIFSFLKKTAKDSNGEIQLTDAIMSSSESGNIILGHILDGKRIDVGSWNYIRDEREHYICMTEDELESIIEIRHKKMDRYMDLV